MFDKFLKKAAVPAVGVVGGGGIGAYVGADIGISALGTATAGTVPVMIVGALLGGAVGYIGKDIYNRFTEEPD